MKGVTGLSECLKSGCCGGYLIFIVEWAWVMWLKCCSGNRNVGGANKRR
jgi:hypothetical protein